MRLIITGLLLFADSVGKVNVFLIDFGFKVDKI